MESSEARNVRVVKKYFDGCNSGDEVVSEWSCIVTAPDTHKHLINRGSEWYVLRGARILELFHRELGVQHRAGGFPLRGTRLPSDERQKQLTAFAEAATPTCV